METKRLILTMLAMGAVTYLPRMLPLAALSQLRLPDRVTAWLGYLPAAILSALIVPGALERGGVPDISPSNPALWALLASFAVALRTRDLILTMAAGGAVLFLLQRLLQPC